MSTVVCPGSFDPVTKGHLDIITRASKLFSHVIVLVVHNPNKHPVFTVEQRIELIKRVTRELPNVEVDTFYGLLAEYTKIKNAVAIVKGLRALTDFEYEFQMALTNTKLNPGTETLFLTTSAENMYLSSSMVKQVAQFGGDISDFIPADILSEVKQGLFEQNGWV